jgi:hypothetical protein
MTHFVVDHVNPLSFGIILPSSFPILRVHEVDCSVLVCSSGSLSPVNVSVPFKPRPLQTVKRTEARDGLAKTAGFMIVKKARKQPINNAPLPHGRQDHEHKSVVLREKIRKSGEHDSGIKARIVIVQVRVRDMTITPHRIKSEVIAEKITHTKTGAFGKAEMAT